MELVHWQVEGEDSEDREVNVLSFEGILFSVILNAYYIEDFAHRQQCL